MLPQEIVVKKMCYGKTLLSVVKSIIHSMLIVKDFAIALELLLAAGIAFNVAAKLKIFLYKMSFICHPIDVIFHSKDHNFTCRFTYAWYPFTFGNINLTQFSSCQRKIFTAICRYYILRRKQYESKQEIFYCKTKKRNQKE